MKIIDITIKILIVLSLIFLIFLTFINFYNPKPKANLPEKKQSSIDKEKYLTHFEDGNNLFLYIGENYLFHMDNKEPGILILKDKNTGKTKWEFKPGVKIYIPKFEKDVVMVITESGEMYILNKETGNILWKKYVGSSSMSVYVNNLIHESYVFIADLLIDLSTMTAFNKETGLVIWSYYDKYQNFDFERIISKTEESIIIPTELKYYPEEKKFFTEKEGTILAVDPSNGQKKWEVNLGRVINKYVYKFDQNYIITLTGNYLYSNIQKIYQANGKIIWQRSYSKAKLFSNNDQECYIWGKANIHNEIVILEPGLMCPDNGSYASNLTLSPTIKINYNSGQEVDL